MPAYFDTGFSVRQVPWHGMGMIADEYPESWDQAREWAGLTWEPEVRPLYVNLPTIGDEVFAEDTGAHSVTGEVDDVKIDLDPGTSLKMDDGTFMVPVPSHRLVVRPDTNRVLGVVSDQFSLISHAAMGEILEAVLGQDNVKFETAGSVKGGSIVWALCYIDEPYTVAGDDSEHYPFLALTNHHDGSGACRIIRTQVRVVCWNTVQAAEAEGDRTGRYFTIRHVGDVTERIEAAKAALGGARDEAKQWMETCSDLFGMPVDSPMLEQYLSEFIPMPEADTITDRVRGNIEKGREVFRHLYLDGITCQAHTGTALGLVDASLEYLDHVRGYNSQSTYLGRTMLRAEPMKAKAIALARRVAAN